MTTAPKIGTSSPIPDTMMIYDDLTILIYRIIIKNNSNSSPPKSVTRAPKIGTSSPIPDRMMMLDSNPLLTHHSNHLLTHHSNQLLSHSLKIPAKIESPRRSLRSLWGLIKWSCYYFVGLQIPTNNALKVGKRWRRLKSCRCSELRMKHSMN